MLTKNVTEFHLVNSRWFNMLLLDVLRSLDFRLGSCTSQNTSPTTLITKALGKADLRQGKSGVLIRSMDSNPEYGFKSGVWIQIRTMDQADVQNVMGISLSKGTSPIKVKMSFSTDKIQTADKFSTSQ